MALDIQTNNTGDTLASMSPDSVRKVWQRGIELAEQTGDFFADMEGKSSSSIIQTKTDTSKGVGQKITFTTSSGFYGEGMMGEDLFEGKDDFEEFLIDSYDMEVDFIRNAFRCSIRTEEHMGMRGEIRQGAPKQLGLWGGRVKSHRLFMMMREKINSENVTYANNKTLNSLGTADTLNYDSIVSMGTRMEPLGGKPAQIGREGKNAIHKNCVVATTLALDNLKKDPDYKAALHSAGERGISNCIFKGGYTNIDGHVIKKYNPIDHDGEGSIGSPINPKASLGVAIPAAFGAGDEVKGGGNPISAAKTKVKYFKDFKNYAYKFLPSDVLAQDGDTHYFLVVNPSNAATDPGKVGMYAYTTGNDGNKITITAALGSDTGRAGTVGDVGFNAGVWSGYHTEVHPAGSTIIPCNSKGVPIGWTYMLGRRAAYRGYGMYRNKRTTETHNGEFIKDVYFMSVFGQKLVEDRLGRHTGIIIQCHALQIPGVKLPVVA